MRTNRPTRGTEDPSFIGRQHSIDNTTGRSAEEENANKNGRKSKIVACVLRAPHNDLQRGRARSAAAQRSSPARDLRHEPKITKKRCSCHVSCQLACDARTCDDSFRGEQPLSPRRAACPGSGEGVIIRGCDKTSKHVYKKSDNVCLASTGDNAYPNPASPFSNLMMSWIHSLPV